MRRAQRTTGMLGEHLPRPAGTLAGEHPRCRSLLTGAKSGAPAASPDWRGGIPRAGRAATPADSRLPAGRARAPGGGARAGNGADRRTSTVPAGAARAAGPPRRADRRRYSPQPPGAAIRSSSTPPCNRPDIGCADAAPPPPDSAPPPGHRAARSCGWATAVVTGARTGLAATITSLGHITTRWRPEASPTALGAGWHSRHGVAPVAAYLRSPGRPPARHAPAGVDPFAVTGPAHRTRAGAQPTWRTRPPPPTARFRDLPCATAPRLDLLAELHARSEVRLFAS